VAARAVLVVIVGNPVFGWRLILLVTLHAGGGTGIAGVEAMIGKAGRRNKVATHAVLIIIVAKRRGVRPVLGVAGSATGQRRRVLEAGTQTHGFHVFHLRPVHAVIEGQNQNGGNGK